MTTKVNERLWKRAPVPIFEPRHFRHGWRCTKALPSFSNEKLEVQKLARMPIFEPSRVKTEKLLYVHHSIE